MLRHFNIRLVKQKALICFTLFIYFNSCHGLNETQTSTNLPSINSTFNRLAPSGNQLWDSILSDCISKPSFMCIQKNVYSYLDTTFNSELLNVTNKILFKKNSNEYQITRSFDNSDENEIPEEFENDAGIHLILQ